MALHVAAASLQQRHVQEAPQAVLLASERRLMVSCYLSQAPAVIPNQQRGCMQLSTSGPGTAN